jgi:hypothetical protein
MKQLKLNFNYKPANKHYPCGDCKHNIGGCKCYVYCMMFDHKKGDVLLEVPTQWKKI